jgi:hypothetical protein
MSNDDKTTTKTDRREVPGFRGYEFTFAPDQDTHHDCIEVFFQGASLGKGPWDAEKRTFPSSAMWHGNQVIAEQIRTAIEGACAELAKKR